MRRNIKQEYLALLRVVWSYKSIAICLRQEWLWYHYIAIGRNSGYSTCLMADITDLTARPNLPTRAISRGHFTGSLSRSHLDPSPRLMRSCCSAAKLTGRPSFSTIAGYRHHDLSRSCCIVSLFLLHRGGH